MAYLGDTPRTYFEDEDASAPTDVAREARGLAFWWAQVYDDGDGAENDAKTTELRAYLADDTGPFADDDGEDEPELDDADVFVEVKTARFINALDLPTIDDLPR